MLGIGIKIAIPRVADEYRESKTQGVESQRLGDKKFLNQIEGDK